MIVSQHPQTSFEAQKNGLRLIFPRGGKSKMFPRAVKVPFPQTLHFLGKLCIPRERERYFQEKKISLRGKILSLRENPPNFPLEGKFCPKRCLGMTFVGKRRNIFSGRPLPSVSFWLGEVQRARPQRAQGKHLQLSGKHPEYPQAILNLPRFLGCQDFSLCAWWLCPLDLSNVASIETWKADCNAIDSFWFGGVLQHPVLK